MPFLYTHPALIQTLAARGYDEPTEVQAAVLQEAATGGDLLVSAQTGSGKTVAFGLAIASNLLQDETAMPLAAAPLALVIAPTRELAMQVHAELSWLYAGVGGKVLACVGGMDPRREQRLLAAGSHIVVGTPGRLRDHIERRQLNTSALRAVVLDEADEMLDLGFREELEFILAAAPPERRTLLFSATIPREIASLAKRFQNNAVRLNIGSRDEPHKDISYTALMVASGETTPAVINVLRYHDARLAIVFCPTREAVRAMWTALNARGFLAVALSGEMAQNERNQALLALRAGRARVCVATDVAARGLDLPELSLVVHAELPMNAALLLHRSGRTGRAGRKGDSIVLVSQSRRRRAEGMLAQAGVDATWEAVPDADRIRQRDHERLLSDPILTEPADEEELAAAAAMASGHDVNAVAVALLRMYRASLPDEEIVTQIVPQSSQGARPVRGSAAEPRERGAKHAVIDDSTWLSVSVGRRENADPKWLLPFLCRVGNVTRDDVGAIRIMTSETLFEVPGRFAEQFLNSKDIGAKDVRIARSEPPRASDRSARPPRSADRTGGRAPRADKRPDKRTDERREARPELRQEKRPEARKDNRVEAPARSTARVRVGGTGAEPSPSGKKKPPHRGR